MARPTVIIKLKEASTRREKEFFFVFKTTLKFGDFYLFLSYNPCKHTLGVILNKCTLAQDGTSHRSIRSVLNNMSSLMVGVQNVAPAPKLSTPCYVILKSIFGGC